VHVLYAPVSGMHDFEDWSLVLLNRDIIATDVTITFYSSEGKPYSAVARSLARKETRRIDIRQLLSAEASEAPPGGVKVEYYGPPMAVASHVTLGGFHGFGGMDVFLQENPEFKSAGLDAIWWEPIGANSYLVLGNSSPDTIHVGISLGPDGSRRVDLPPFATVVEPIQDENEEASADGRILSAHVISSGVPGALRATGFSTDFSEHFFSVVYFVDPKLSTEPALYANGLHFADASTRLLVKNVGGSPITVSGKVYPLDRLRSAKPVDLVSKALAVGEVGELPLPAQSEKLEGAAARLESSGGPASMIATFSSVEATHRVARSLSFADTSAYSALTGGYPWRIDGDYTSIVSITNIGRSRAAVAGFIRPDIGKDYKIDTKYLEMGETAIFEMRQIRDQQVPDRKGIKLAKNVTTGQFDWSSILGDGSERLVGRADINSLSLGVNSPPTVTQCNCPLSAIDAFINPDLPFVTVGGQTTADTEVQYRDVCNGESSDDPFSALLWSFGIPNIISVTTGVYPATVKGLAAGDSTFTTDISLESWTFSPSNGCSSTRQSVKPSGTGTVQKPTSLKVVSYPILPLTSVGCVATDYGMAIAITYQVLDQNGSPLQSSSMEPQEELLNQVFNGSDPISPYPNWVDIYNPNWPGSTKYTTSAGQFLDAPFVTCATEAFVETSQQPISMLMNGTNYTVKTNNWKTVTTVPGGHGTMSNGSDINASN
jgi:hypothetical protein